MKRLNIDNLDSSYEELESEDEQDFDGILPSHGGKVLSVNRQPDSRLGFVEYLERRVDSVLEADEADEALADLLMEDTLLNLEEEE